MTSTLVQEGPANVFRALLPGMLIVHPTTHAQIGYDAAVLHWTDEMRATWSLFLVPDATVPEGQQVVSRSYARVAGVVTQVLETEPIEAGPPPPPPSPPVLDIALSPRPKLVYASTEGRGVSAPGRPEFVEMVLAAGNMVLPLRRYPWRYADGRPDDLPTLAGFDAVAAWARWQAADIAAGGSGVPDSEDGPTLEEFKTASLQAVRVLAEQARIKYVSPGTVKAMIYLVKADEAQAFLTWRASHPSDTPDPENFPLLASTLGFEGATLDDVAALVATTAANWKSLAALIEGKVATAKSDIEAATTVDGVIAAAVLDLTDLPPPTPAPS